MYTSFVNPRDPDQSLAKETLARWTRDMLAAPEDCPVYISEMQCSEPSCPTSQTLITVMSQPGSQTLRIHKPLVFVRKPDILLAISQLEGIT
ncbi:MAG: hypothetical protein EAZ89_10540 [Bacteroidetes bacterium]|nr:MAG: hypothetical protein EAZ89_10540 [Bacteroidota bacterium]